ncbi:MAG: MFS transporter [Patescibacteria group bacterium]
MSPIRPAIRQFARFTPFWIFLTFFKFAGSLHYSLLSPLGERLMPIWAVGFLIGGASLVQLSLDVPAGRLLDRFGYRRLLILSSLIFFAGASCLFLKFSLGTYLASIFLSIFGWLFMGPGVNAYILSSAPKERAGRFMALRDVFGSVGNVLASVLLPFVLLLSPTRMGLVLALSFMAAIVAILLSPRDRVSVHAQIKLPTQHYYIRRELHSSIKMIKRLNPASTMLLLLNSSGGIFYAVIWFVVPLVLANQADNFLLGIGLGTFDFAVVVLGFLLGSLADRLEKRTLVFFGLLIFSLFGMLLGFGFGLLFVLFGFLATTGDEMAGISLWSWLNTLDREHAHDGAVAGVITLFEDLGWMIGPALAGVFYVLIGPTWTVVVGALPILFSWALYWFVFQKHAIPHLYPVDVPKKPHKRRHKM